MAPCSRCFLFCGVCTVFLCPQLLVSDSSSVVGLANTPHKWKVGTWSECRDDVYHTKRLQCAVHVAVRKRQVWCPWKGRNQNVSVERCLDFRKQPNSWEMCAGPCYAVRKSTFQWQVTPWRCNRTSGIQRRHFVCLHAATQRRVAAHVCKAVLGARRGAIFRRCRATRRSIARCSFSYWSPWSACSRTCGRGHQLRFRFPVRFPQGAKYVCPSVMVVRSCQTLPPCRKQLALVKVGKWGPCQLQGASPSNSTDQLSSTNEHLLYPEHVSVFQQPLVSLQERAVNCVSDDGRLLLPGECNGRVPVTGVVKRHCIVDRNCVVTAWRSWKIVDDMSIACRLEVNGQTIVWPTNTTARRTREIIWQPFGNGARCPHLHEEVLANLLYNHSALQQLEVCKVLYEWYAGEWDVCRAYLPSLGCGRGHQRRNIICQRRHDPFHRPVAEHFCRSGLEIEMFGSTDSWSAVFPKPAIRHGCNIPCPVDCRLSDWGQWSSCKYYKCSSNEQVITKGKRVRRRSVLTEPLGGGRQCEHLAETNECGDMPCKRLVVSEAKNCPQALSLGYFENSRWGCVRFGPFDATRQESFECLCKSSCPRPTDINLYKKRIWHIPRRGEFCYQSKDGNMTKWFQVSALTNRSEERRGCPTYFKLHPCRPERYRSITYHWTSSVWTGCERLESLRHTARHRLYEFRKVGCKVCYAGHRYRQVHCSEQNFENGLMNTRAIGMKRNARLKCPEEAWYRPSSRELCFYCCPQDCQLSAWSSWGKCSETLRCEMHPYADGCRNQRYPKNQSGDQCEAQARQGLQRRRRYTLTYRQHGGRPCPPLIEDRLCSLREVTCFHWKVGEWSRCHFPSGQICLGGYQTRPVYCIGADGKATTADRCYDKARPSSARDCSTDCNPNCRFATWSSWSACSYSCGIGHRRRTRVAIPGISVSHQLPTFSRACGAMIEVERCNSNACQKYRLREHSWGPWLPTISRRGHHFCYMQRVRLQSCRITGQRRKKVPWQFCADQTNKTDDGVVRQDMYPLNPGSQCPPECAYSSWSAWTRSCNASCGHGWKYRLRQNLSSLECTTTKELTPCFEKSCPTSRYKWSTEPWGPCRLPYSTANEFLTFCLNKEGSQIRNVMCKRYFSNGTVTIVHERKCKHFKKPSLRQPCLSTCPEDCMWSPWQAWSPCRGGYKQRNRTILRQAVGQGVPCRRHLVVKERVCAAQRTERYTTSFGNWSPCQPLDGEERCGEGKRTRLVVCLDSNRQLVDFSHCRHKILRDGVTEESCALSCHKNCRVTEWSSWSACPNQCDAVSYSIRRRRILSPAMGNGAPCPRNNMLRQRRPCITAPCYKLETSIWSSCFIDGADCGEGIMIRNKTCRRSDGLLTHLRFCQARIDPLAAYDRDLLIVHERHVCSTPCPGRCRVSVWSSWSSCVALCENFKMVRRLYRGKQLRQRHVKQLPGPTEAPCQERLWQVRQCKTPTCSTFRWKTGPWKKGKRQVWCERSDGLRVTGACQDHLRPPRSKTAGCYPPCAGGKVCQENSCRCPRGFVSISETGDLQCAPPPCNGDADCPSRPSKRSARDVHLMTSSRPPDSTLRYSLWLAPYRLPLALQLCGMTLLCFFLLFSIVLLTAFASFAYLKYSEFKKQIPS